MWAGSVSLRYSLKYPVVSGRGMTGARHNMEEVVGENLVLSVHRLDWEEGSPGLHSLMMSRNE